MISDRAEATIIVKAAPRVGKTHGELVCCAGIEQGRVHGTWVRLYPVAFRTLEDAQKFGRWDIIRYRWRPKAGDIRAESRRVDHGSIEIVGHVKSKHRQNLIAPLVKTGLSSESVSGRSLAFLRPQEPRFYYVRKTENEYEEERLKFSEWHKHETEGLFGMINKRLVPYEPSPYLFRYSYICDDGKRDGTCQDWEIETTFLKWRRAYSEEKALLLMRNRFGEEYPEKGFVLAMGTHRAYPQWLINGIVRLDHNAERNIQETLF